ncbi:MAG: hypothetical protein GY749_34425 [Desulfobacteraceae bacterium]|nr:hypothetical protein [Desulfobacteraceae bacterium]
MPLIEKIYKKRQNSKQPWFKHAAYRAIDEMLIHIELHGNEQHKKALEEFSETVGNRETDGVYTRVMWTVDQL